MIRRLFALLVLLAPGCGDEKTQLEKNGYVLEALDEGRVLELRRGADVLLRLPADAIQIGAVGELDRSSSYDPYWLVYEDALFKPDPPKDLRFLTVQKVSAQGDSERIVLDADFGSSTTAKIELAFGSSSDFRGQAFTMKVLPASNLAIAYVRIRARFSADEAFYGLGEWPDAVNHRGKLRPMQLEPELALESANNEAHAPVPLLIGTRGASIFVESKRFGLFDVARTEADLVEITYGTAEQSADGLLVHLFGMNHPLDATSFYYDVTGDPLLPAEWAYGPWIWRDENDDQAQVEDDIRLIRELDLATSAIWIDRPYATAVNTFDFDVAKFPDPTAMIGRAHDAGLRVALWHTPYLEENAAELLAEARSRGFYPPRVGLRLNGWGDLIDLTNPEAFAWWQSLIDRYTSMGIEGFKLDYGEDVIGGLGNARTPWEFHDGSTELTAHYEYTKLYHRAYAEKLPASGAFLLCRTGRWGDQKNVSVIWPGDLDATLTKHREVLEGGEIGVGGLPASVIMSLSLGPSGFPFYGSDTGGYRHSPPDKETFIRWFQQTALSAVMQVGDSSSQPPWVFTQENGRDPATLDLYREFARLHLRLFPYVWSYATRLAEDGRALMRPLGLAYPEMGVHPDDVYLLGENLLVAPVVERGVTRRLVSLPAGLWYSFFDGTMYQGTVEVDAPLEKLPLFVREGGIVPMLRETIDTLSTTTSTAVESYANDPGVLHVRVARGEGDFMVFDGTEISVKPQGDALEVRFRAGSKFTNGYVVELLGGETKTLAPGETTVVVR